MFDFNLFYTDNVLPWLLDGGVRILVIIIGAWIVKKFGHIATEKFVKRIITPDHFLSPEAEEKRENTLIRIVDGTLGIAVILAASMMVLEELGIAIGPLIAAAGIAGLAFGFGGQYLIKDVITGLFIILENQYRVGDVVCFGKTCGKVEDISLRSTILRDMDGTVHNVPHGSISEVANLSKDFSRVNLNVGVSYNVELEKVIRVVNEVGQELAEDEEWRDKIVSAPQFLRVNDFADSSVVIKILGDTKPTEQWAVTGELRKRLKIAFDKEKIEIPFPQRVIHKS